jgi:hypothetical protein
VSSPRVCDPSAADPWDGRTSAATQPLPDRTDRRDARGNIPLHNAQCTGWTLSIQGPLGSRPMFDRDNECTVFINADNGNVSLHVTTLGAW